MAPKEKWFNRKRLIRIIPALVWMLLIFLLSHRTTKNISDTVEVNFLIYKTLHIIEYFILAVLLYIYIQNYKYTIISAYLYSMSDEFHQTFIVGRQGRLRDTFIDFIGIILAIIFVNILKKHIKIFSIDDK